MKEYWHIDKKTGELVCSNRPIDDPEFEFMIESEAVESLIEDDEMLGYNVKKRINMTKHVVDILDRKHRDTLGQLRNELSRYMDKAKGNVRSRLHKILSMLETKGEVFRVSEYYYRLHLKEFIKRRYGETLDKKKLAVILGMPFESVEPLIKRFK